MIENIHQVAGDIGQRLSHEIERKGGYPPSDGHTIQPWDRIFFGKRKPIVPT